MNIIRKWDNMEGNPIDSLTSHSRWLMPVSNSSFVFRETYIERSPGESVNDRNDRAIRRVCTWYRNHLKGIEIILVTEDKNNLEKAKNEGLHGLTMLQYAERFLEKTPELADLVAITSERDELLTETSETFEPYEEVGDLFFTFSDWRT